jgi:hypothetical protein
LYGVVGGLEFDYTEETSKFVRRWSNDGRGSVGGYLACRTMSLEFESSLRTPSMTLSRDFVQSRLGVESEEQARKTLFDCKLRQDLVS